MLAHFTRKMLVYRQYFHIERPSWENLVFSFRESLKLGLILIRKMELFQKFYGAQHESLYKL
jgi:hypothetical protein